MGEEGRVIMDNIIRITKAMLWEEAKGKLLALVAVEGQVPPHDPIFKTRRDRYRKAELVINSFIEDFESEGLHE